MKRLIMLFTLLPLFTVSQQTYVPDDAFEAYLEANGMGNGIPNDDYVTTANISGVTTLNISNGASGGTIVDLTGIEAFTALTTLACYGNQLTSLNVSNNTALTYLFCHDNQLTCLNAANGNNIIDFIAEFNPPLTCIEVDDATWSTANWTYIDAQTSFSEDCNNDCSTSTVGINETTPNINLYPNPTNDLITLEIEGYNGSVNVEVYDLQGRLLETTTNTTISMGEYAKGIYVFKVAYGDSTQELKVVKD